MSNNITMMSDTDYCDYVSYVILDLSAVSEGNILLRVAMLRKQVEEMGQLNQGLFKEKEEFLRREQAILKSHSKGVIALRQENMDLKIIKQRKEVLKAEARRKNEERTQELEEEKVELVFMHPGGVRTAMLNFFIVKCHLRNILP